MWYVMQIPVAVETAVSNCSAYTMQSLQFFSQNADEFYFASTVADMNYVDDSYTGVEIGQIDVSTH